MECGNRRDQGQSHRGKRGGFTRSRDHSAKPPPSGEKDDPFIQNRRFSLPDPPCGELHAHLQYRRIQPCYSGKEIVVTAELPLIDKTSTNTSFHLTTTELETIPSQYRTVVDAVKITPGVTGVRFNTRRGTATQGLPSFRGEGEEGTNWIVDGLSISGVRLRNAGMHLNYDSMDEIQIISDPFSPEFGSAEHGHQKRQQ